MRQLRLGMRWWLGAVFVVIASLAAVLVATVSSRQADHAIRSNAQNIAVGEAVAAGFAVEREIGAGDLEATIAQIASRRRLALFVFSARGSLLTPPSSRGLRWSTIPDAQAALAAALADHRFVRSDSGSGATVVALPLRRTPTARALVAFAARPAAYGTSLTIFHRAVFRAALWAALIAAVAGLLAATLIAGRLRRIASAAHAIEQGDFETELRPGFLDEVGVLASTIDRMRRRLQESFERVRGERDRLELLFEQLQEGVVAVDSRLLVRFANASARDILDEVVVALGEPLPASCAGLPLREVAQALFRADAAVAEARTQSRQGERTISLVGLPARGSDLVVLVFADITAQERRERTEREFVANASHELRTPVSAILSAVDALEAGAKDDPADRELFIELIARQAKRLGRLSRSLLVLARSESRQEPVRLELIELRPLLEDVVASFDPPPEVTLEVECPTGLEALAQRDLAEQILSNLTGNALKYTSSGRVVVSGRRVGDNVVVEVRDTGPGISGEVRQRIFDRFSSGEQGQRRGFGLGLAIVAESVRALGGSLDVDSEPGTGTTMRVTLAGAAKP